MQFQGGGRLRSHNAMIGVDDLHAIKNCLARHYRGRWGSLAVEIANVDGNWILRNRAHFIQLRPHDDRGLCICYRTTSGAALIISLCAWNAHVRKRNRAFVGVKKWKASGKVS